MRYIATFSACVLLAACGTEKTGGPVQDEGAANSQSGEALPEGAEEGSASLDRSELSEVLVATLINENMPDIRCGTFRVRQFFNAVVPGDTTERFRVGTDSFPRELEISRAASKPYDGLDGLISGGLMTAERVRDYSRDYGTHLDAGTVYRIDFSEATRNSPAVRINVNQSVTNQPGVLMAYCPGPRQINNVQYTLPGGNSTTSATFSWSIEINDDVGDALYRDRRFWLATYGTSLPSRSGSGVATLNLTNNGWQVSNVRITEDRENIGL